MEACLGNLFCSHLRIDRAGLETDYRANRILQDLRSPAAAAAAAAAEAADTTAIKAISDGRNLAGTVRAKILMRAHWKDYFYTRW
jgi:tRNA threonylcarbamoyladenosine modification (KEOPS) complex Cgi121 subunit